MRHVLRSSLSVAALAGAIALASPAGAQIGTGDATRDPLAGHRAEYDQATGDRDPLRRPLFFDAVDIDGPSPGVPCDHLAARRPEVIAGKGWVVLLETAEARPRRIRFWIPPPATPEADVAEAAARSFAAARAGGAEFKLVGLRHFGWCR